MTEHKTLYDLLIAPSLQRRHIINDGAALVRSRVSQMTGLKGMALKGGLKTLEKAVPGAVDNILDRLLDEGIEQLEPLYKAHVTRVGEVAGFGRILEENKDQITDGWLKIIDRKAERVTQKQLRGLYKSIRPKGHGYIVDAMPDIGVLLERALENGLKAQS